ncbi:hypothetical protein OROMI_026089 [Orobanche minor]
MSINSSSYGCYSSSDSREEIEEVSNETGNDMVAAEAENKEPLTVGPVAPVEVLKEVPTTAQVSKCVARKRKRSTGPQISKQKSMAWQHFTKYDKKLFSYQEGKKVHAGHDKRALCNYCGADLKADSSYNGMSSLLRHIQKVCKKYAGRENINDGQALLVGDVEAKHDIGVVKVWTQERCIQAACEMIVIDDRS